MSGMRSHIVSWAVLASLAGTPVSLASAHERESTAAAPSQVRDPPSSAMRASRAEEARYALREAKSPDARHYRAGDVIVISASAVAVVLLVVLLVILI